MDRIKLLNLRQEEAVNAWSERSYRGIVEAAVGFGKTMVFFKAMQRLIDDKIIEENSTVWYLAETTVREHTLNEEYIKYEKLFGKLNLNIEFYCYQAKPEGVPAAIGADEIHDALTPKYHAVLKNNCPILGITATMPNSIVSKDDGSEFFNVRKTTLARRLGLPVVWKYSMTQGIEEGLLSPYKITVVDHQLDDVNKIYKTTSKGKTVWRTEKDNYKSKTNVINFLYRSGKEGPAIGLERKLYKTLYGLPSKLPVVQELLKTSGKTIVFANDIDFLFKVTPNVVCSRHTKKQNQAIIDAFNAGDIQVIASFKMLTQGITLEGVESAILASYYSKAHKLIQQLGRVVRFVKDKVAGVYILRTKDTAEERWFRTMFRNRIEHL